MRIYGDALILFSGDPADPVNHARMKCVSFREDTWVLSVPRHTARWEETAFSGSQQELLQLLVHDFDWLLHL